MSAVEDIQLLHDGGRDLCYSIHSEFAYLLLLLFLAT